jgi:hypothetical protein
MKYTACALFFAIACSSTARAQATPDPAGTLDSIQLTVGSGTPLRVALENEIAIKKIGQPIRGRIVEPVYAFDQIVVPIGSEVVGEITEIEKTSKEKRAEALLNADLTPERGVTVTFDELILPDGRRVPIKTNVSAGTSQPVHLAAKESEQEKKGAASKTIEDARRQFQQEWDAGVSQVETPGRVHRLERYLMAQLPYHVQYAPAGTRYNAELQEPLNFGTEAYSAQTMSVVGSVPPAGSIVHALLVTPLSSATAKKDAPVSAILSEPLFSASHELILPQGTRLEGLVIQARPARDFKRNGELRFVFRKMELPEGAERTITASLEGVEVGRSDNMELDSEGGAHSVSPKTRYLSTGISIALVAASAVPDFDEGLHGSGTTGTRAAAGGAGYRLIGIALSLAVHSRPLAIGLGSYGAALSIYTHFLSRGQEVVFPKNTAMDVGFGGRAGETQKAPGMD